MTTILSPFLFKKKTLAVAGVLVVVMVGGGIKLRSYLEKRRETIEIVERLLNEASENVSLSGKFTKAKVTYDEPNRRKVFQDTKELAKRKRAKKSYNRSLTVTKAAVIYDGTNKRTMRGVVRVSGAPAFYSFSLNYENAVHLFAGFTDLHLDIELENQQGEWRIVNIDYTSYRSYWDRIKNSVITLLL